MNYRVIGGGIAVALILLKTAVAGDGVDRVYLGLAAGVLILTLFIVIAPMLRQEERL